MISKAIIPAAGFGTRLLPATKEQPKEMLPILVKDANGRLVLKPFLQVVFEQLYDFGFRDMCFVVGRGKRSIEDHFTFDKDFMTYLRTKNKNEHYRIMASLYKKVQNSTIAFANQPQPLGLADAVYRARFFSGKENFLVHAGDDLISPGKACLQRLVSVFNECKSDATLFVEKVKDPTRYGVVVGKEVRERVYHAKRIIEKPKTAPSRLAVVAVYVFKPILYEAIEQVGPDQNGERQLSDALQILVDQRDAVYAVELARDERRIDIGDPISYKRAFVAESI